MRASVRKTHDSQGSSCGDKTEHLKRNGHRAIGRPASAVTCRLEIGYAGCVRMI